MEIYLAGTLGIVSREKQLIKLIKKKAFKFFGISKKSNLQLKKVSSLSKMKIYFAAIEPHNINKTEGGT